METPGPRALIVYVVAPSSLSQLSCYAHPSPAHPKLLRPHHPLCHHHSHSDNNKSTTMNDAEDVCGCLTCAVLCGVCCVAAAEEDKRERERAAAEASGRLKNPMIQVNPVAVLTPRSQKSAAAAGAGALPARAAGSSEPTQDQYHAFHPPPRSPPHRNARTTASYRNNNAYLPPSQ